MIIRIAKRVELVREVREKNVNCCEAVWSWVVPGTDWSYMLGIESTASRHGAGKWKELALTEE